MGKNPIAFGGLLGDPTRIDPQPDGRFKYLNTLQKIYVIVEKVVYELVTEPDEFSDKVRYPEHFYILRCLNESTNERYSVKVVMDPADIAPLRKTKGIRVKFFGKSEKKSEQFGLQFRAYTYEVLSGIEKDLPGIQQRNLQRLLVADYFCGTGLRWEAHANFLNHIQDSDRISTTEECVDERIDQMLINPFQLIWYRLEGANHSGIDKAYLRTGLPADLHDRRLSELYQWLKRNANGDTLHYDYRVNERANIPVEWIDDLINRGVAERPIGGEWTLPEDRCFQLSIDHSDEVSIAESVKRISDGFRACWIDQKATIHDVSEHQMLAIESTIFAGNFSILTGGPGTGKTYTIAKLLRSFEDDVRFVRVLAPTGKAAVRAREAIGLGDSSKSWIKTIHSYLFTCQDDSPGLYIIDECSMIDASLMARILRKAARCGSRVLLVGDPKQLPPVGQGAPFRDLIASGLVPHFHLNVTRRNSGAIVRVCSEIDNGGPMMFSDETKTFAYDDDKLTISENPDDNCVILPNVKPSVVVRELLKAVKPEDLMVITALNNLSASSRESLNLELSPLFHPDRKPVVGNKFSPGDRVMCLRNDHRIAVLPRFSGETVIGYEIPKGIDAFEFDPKVYVANGELCTVVYATAVVTIVKTSDGKYAQTTAGTSKSPRADLTSEERNIADEIDQEIKEDFVLGWAITGHKSQGSDWPVVVCVIDEAAGRVASREYWYTAISRAKKLCVLVGSFDALIKQISKTQTEVRQTDLVRKIKQEFNRVSSTSLPGNPEDRI